MTELPDSCNDCDWNECTDKCDVYKKVYKKLVNPLISYSAPTGSFLLCLAKIDFKYIEEKIYTLFTKYNNTGAIDLCGWLDCFNDDKIVYRT